MGKGRNSIGRGRARYANVEQEESWTMQVGYQVTMPSKVRLLSLRRQGVDIDRVI